MQLFVLDDDDETREVVGRALCRAGHEVTLASSFRDALEQLVASTFDVLVLDVMLGAGSGLELCAELRARGIETPILFLSARGAVRARIEGFEAGGDDYLPKPFAIRELLVRVDALGRRRPALRPSVLELGSLELDFERRRALVASQQVSLTGREWDVLVLLADAGGRVVPFDTLLERAWGDSDGSRASLTVIASRLRRKLESACNRRVVRTVRGVGYALELDR